MISITDTTIHNSGGRRSGMRDELPASARAVPYFTQRPEERQPAAGRMLQRQNLRLWTREVQHAYCTLWCKYY